jgi:hypothetical protein
MALRQQLQEMHISQNQPEKSYIWNKFLNNYRVTFDAKYLKEITMTKLELLTVMNMHNNDANIILIIDVIREDGVDVEDYTSGDEPGFLFRWH